MTFFDHQERARKRSRWLVVAYILAIFGMIAVVNLVLFALTSANQSEFKPEQFLPLFFAVSAGTLLLILGGSAYQIHQLSGGGSSVALMLGGKNVDPQTNDPEEKKLRNIVEEMAIASGVPVPEVFILEENGINAFAAGTKINDASITVTRGAIRNLNRDELQGVIAHEFSHIFNGDMKLNTRLAGLLFGILLLSYLGKIIFYSSDSRSKKNGSTIVLGLALIVIGSIGVFFGRLIQAAVSRQREFLADASAVQFTRNPQGIAGALKKIGGLYEGSRVDNVHAVDMSYFFFSDIRKERVFNFFDTHPPLVERIRAIDPHFDGNFPEVIPVSREIPLTDQDLKRANKDRFVRMPQQFATSSAVLPSTHAELSSALKEKAREPLYCRALVYAIFLDPIDRVRETQYEIIQKHSEEGVFEATKKIEVELQQNDESLWIQLVDLSLPAIKILSDKQYENFLDVLKALIQADNKVSLLEFSIYKMIKASRKRPGEKKQASQFYSLKPLLDDLSLTLSLVAYTGVVDPSSARKSFDMAAKRLNVDDLKFLPEQVCTLQRLDQSLNRMALAIPPLKERILDACFAVVKADTQITTKEFEILRAIASVLECPMAPEMAAAV